MAFGKFTADNQLENQKEFLRNCLVQLDDLEARVDPVKMASLRQTYAAVWVDGPAIRELPDKVDLARRFAEDLTKTLGTTKVVLDSVSSALQSLQSIIDHCEETMQDLLAGLVARQSVESIGMTDNAQD